MTLRREPEPGLELELEPELELEQGCRMVMGPPQRKRRKENIRRRVGGRGAGVVLVYHCQGTFQRLLRSLVT